MAGQQRGCIYAFVFVTFQRWSTLLLATQVFMCRLTFILKFAGQNKKITSVSPTITGVIRPQNDEKDLSICGNKLDFLPDVGQTYSTHYRFMLGDWSQKRDKYTINSIRYH